MTKRGQKDIHLKEDFMKPIRRTMSQEEKIKALHEFGKVMEDFLNWAGMTIDEFLREWELLRNDSAERYFEKNYGIKRKSNF